MTPACGMRVKLGVVWRGPPRHNLMEPRGAEHHVPGLRSARSPTARPDGGSAGRPRQRRHQCAGIYTPTHNPVCMAERLGPPPPADADEVSFYGGNVGRHGGSNSASRALLSGAWRPSHLAGPCTARPTLRVPRTCCGPHIGDELCIAAVSGRTKSARPHQEQPLFTTMSSSESALAP